MGTLIFLGVGTTHFGIFTVSYSGYPTHGHPNLDDKIIQNFQNKIIIIQKLNLEVVFIFAHEIESIHAAS